MNSWIGGSLSSLKGQLTHLITEGTEEVSDPKGDLILAQQKITDLECQIRSLSSDVKELNERNSELKIKLQSEEMLLQNVSDSYKEKVKEKEECIELLKEQLSSCSLGFNEGRFNCQNDSSLMQGDEWNSELYDFVNQSHSDSTITRSGINEVDSLKQRINEISQEVIRWRTIAESSQCNEEFGTEKSEGSVAKFLEMQRQDLELMHSNYILELQHEHNKQLDFYKRTARQRSRSSGNDDYEPSELVDQMPASHPVSPPKAHVTDTEVQTMYTLIGAQDIWMDDDRRERQRAQVANASVTVGQQPIMHDASCQCSMDTVSLDTTLADSVTCRQLTQPQGSLGYNVGDSMSQVSDISEVSIKSRLLDEHVRHLSDRIEEYGHQLTSIDDVAMTTAVEDSDPEEISNKLQHLKMKLSQRKNVIIEHNNEMICVEGHVPESSTCADSWEDSSDISLIQEAVVDNNEQMTNLETRIRDIYYKLYLQHPVSELSTLEVLGHISDKVVSVVSGAGGDGPSKEAILSLYAEVMGHAPSKADVDSLLGDIEVKFETLRDDLRLLDEKYADMEDVVDTLRQERATLDDEILEFAKINSEYEEKIKDMSATIIRYEDLEKVCDRYERELSELKGSSIKNDLCMDSEDILEHVETFNEEKDECIEKLESRIIRLQNFCEEKDDFINAMNKKELEVMYEYNCSIDVLNSELDSVRATVEKCYENEVDYKKQIYRMNADLREKDEMINSLNEELTMLSHQNTEEEELIVIRVHDEVEGNTQTDVGQEDSMMAVLQMENKRLGEVIEAQAGSLGQYEARVNCLDAEIARLTQYNGGLGVPVESSEEMTRETLHHLSQMIRDKDWEIEALKSKNESLCAIIKQSGPGSDEAVDIVGPIDALLAEKEALAKEVQWYQENRDQLVTALNVKHKESLNYHGEIQRLVAFINAEQSKWNDATMANERLREEVRNLALDNNKARVGSGLLVDSAVEYVGQLPSYDECVGLSNAGAQCSALQERVESLEIENRRCSGEIRRLETQLQQVSFELEGCRMQLCAAVESQDLCQAQMTHYRDELARKCTAEVHTSCDLVDRTKDIWTESRRAEDEVAETVVVEMTGIPDDGDQVRALQLQCQEYVSQIDQLRTKEMKLLKDKQIFQEHLIRIEESYTQDATIAEDREQCLRTQLRHTEDQLSLNEGRVADLERQVDSLRGNLLTETCDTRRERDEALKRLKDTENRLADTVTSLNNLQTVLDKFQQDQAQELAFQKDCVQQELRSIRYERDTWHTQCQQLQASLNAQNDIVEAAQRLTDQMERKDDQLAEIQATMSRKEEVIDSLKMEIRKLNSVTESKVDKVLMRNLVIGYFHTPLNKRQDALRVIGSLLQFSDKDYHQILMSRRHGDSNQLRNLFISDSDSNGSYENVDNIADESGGVVTGISAATTLLRPDIGAATNVRDLPPQSGAGEDTSTDGRGAGRPDGCRSS